MAENQVIWTEHAKTDLEEIVLYIARDSIAIAESKYYELKFVTTKLKDFPKSGRVIPELEEQILFTYREKNVTPWRIMYKVDKERIYILAILDGRRNIEDILLNRQLRR
jgi:toxin ParE1/3/4